MLVPTSPNRVPPGGYCRYKDPDTGLELAHPYLNVLQELAMKHRVANKLQFDPTVFIQTVCASTPGMPCHEADDRRANIVQQVAGFSKSLKDWLKRGMAMASEELLEARLKKCNGCMYWGGSTGGSLISGRCGKCGCRGVKLALATSNCPMGYW